MKKIMFVLMFSLTGLFAFSQYSPIYVSGTVKDVNGNPLAYYPVMISADSSMGGWYYYNTIQTDSSGYFNVTITPPASVSQGFYAYTYDCNKNILDTFFTNATQNINLAFVICIYTPPSCMADFYYYPDSSGMYTFNFADLSSGTPTNYYWSFGDSTFSTLQNPTHTFSKGTYQVCLSISDSATNCYDTYCTWLYLDDSSQNNCSSYFSYYPNGLTVDFSSMSMSTDYSIIACTWDFGDGYSGTGRNPTHTYPSNGQYFVTLVTTSVDSLNDTCISKYYDYVYLGQQQYRMIYGTISSKSYAVDKAIVYLISYNPKDSTLTAVDSFNAIDSGGVAMYYFANVANGDYLVKAALTSSSINYSHCIPTYYGDVLYWNQASTVTIDTLNPYVSANIEMVTGTNPAGPGFIGGKTSKGANIWMLNPGAPMKNVEVLLLDQSGAPITYDFSKSTGDFGFNSLPFGTYQVYAEVPGKITVPAVVTIDAQNPSINNIQIIITDEGVITSVKYELSESVSKVGNIYPNPAQTVVNIDLNIKKMVGVDVQVINAMGQVMNTSNYKLTAGNNTITLQTAILPQGIYNLKINSTDGANISKSFTIIK